MVCAASISAFANHAGDRGKSRFWSLENFDRALGKRWNGTALTVLPPLSFRFGTRASKLTLLSRSFGRF